MASDNLSRLVAGAALAAMLGSVDVVRARDQFQQRVAERRRVAAADRGQ